MTNQWYLIPEYNGFFNGMLQTLGTLREVINEKWSQEQTQAYLKFIDDFSMYISGYVFTGQVAYWEDFDAWKESIRTTYNPVGFNLYEKQLNYLEKVMNGEPIFGDKKKNKGNKPAQQQQSKAEPKYKPLE